MKTQARKLAAVGLAAAMSVTMLAACGTKATPENLLRDMSERAGETESLSANMKMDMEMSMYGDASSLSLDLDMEALGEPEMSSAKGEIRMGSGSLDLITEMETYSEKKNGEYVVYTMVDDKWTVETADSAEMSANMSIVAGDFNKFADKFELNEDLTEVNGKECFELTGELDGEVLAQLMDEDMLNSFTGLGSDEEDLEEMILPCTIDIYRDSILPARIYFDMGDSLFSLVEDFGVDRLECTVELTFLEYNEVQEIVIPKEALEASAEDDDSWDSDDDWWDSDDDDDWELGLTPVEPAEQRDDLGDTWTDFTVQINDTVLTLPCTLEDLEKTGFAMDTEMTPEDYIVNRDDYELTWFMDDYGNEIMVHMVNTSDEPKEVVDCLVGGIRVDNYSVAEGGSTILFPGGIQIGADAQDAVDAYGTPDDTFEDDVYGDTYHWYVLDGYLKWCEIGIDGESGLIDTMDIACY